MGAPGPDDPSTPTKQDLKRERELFKFYKPQECKITTSQASPVSDSDPQLLALSQLVTLRLNVHRAMVNLIGRDNQYTVVEPTHKGQRYLSPDIIADDAWIGDGGYIPKKLSLCEVRVEARLQNFD